jgi:hypothetical protein
MTVTASGQAAADIAAARPGAVQGRGPWQLAWERLRRDPVAVASAATLALIAVAALAAPLVAHAVGHGPDDQYHDIGVTTPRPACRSGPAGPSSSAPTTSAATCWSASSTGRASRCWSAWPPLCWPPCPAWS